MKYECTKCMVFYDNSTTILTETKYFKGFNLLQIKLCIPFVHTNLPAYSQCLIN